MAKLLSVEKRHWGTEKWWLHTGEDGEDRITCESVQDVEPVLEANKKDFNEAPRRFGKGSMHLIARIPSVVVEEQCRIHQISFREMFEAKTDRAKRIWKELLNAREFRAFRTRPGRIDVKGRE